MTTTQTMDLDILYRSNGALLDELADEARTYLQLLARRQAGENVEGDLFGSVAHLGTHASLLQERLIQEAVLADDVEDARQ